MDELRDACACVAERATRVTIAQAAVPAYAAGLTRSRTTEPFTGNAPVEDRAAAVLTLDAINFGSGWFPTLRKRDGLSGYNTIAAAWREEPTPHAEKLVEIDRAAVARALGQDPDHELMGLYAASLRDLGQQVCSNAGGSFAAVAASAMSAVELAQRLGSWPCFADTARYDDLRIPFLKRAQIAVADLHRAGVESFGDLDRLTMFADNLVPHVLRLDGVLHFDPGLVSRIERGELIEHGSPEEVEIRACALHAVELIVAHCDPAMTAAAVDEVLWTRGQQPSYKAVPRHRSRCTAY
jgi:hypothetical protein